MTRTWLLSLSAVICASCGVGPKPESLRALERFMATPEVRRAQALGGVEVVSAEDAHGKATEAWRDNEPARVSYWAQLANIEFAIAVGASSEKKNARQIEHLEQQLRLALQEEQQLAEQRKQLKELIALHEELAVAHSSAMEKQLHLTEVQARNAVTAARVAVQQANAVDAKIYAPKLYQAAAEMLTRAEKLLQKDKLTKASTTAELTKKKAEEATAKARPLYLKRRESEAQSARNQQLQQQLTEAAKGHRGVKVKLVAGEQEQRLVVSLTYFFPLHKEKPHLKKREILQQLCQVLKNYPNYPLLFATYSSQRTPKKARPKLTQARAKAVAELVLAAGLSEKRFAAEGRGGDRLVGYRFSQVNDRLEIEILLR